MTEIRTTVDQASEAEPGCWCCGQIHPADQMVKLGNHPEVRLCLRCAHFVHQRAWEIEDHNTRGPASLVRDKLRNLRAGVMRRGWHQDRFIGGGLRWLGKHLP
jgi:hypothetical protein